LGGFGGGVVDVMAVMEQFGKGIVAEPFMANVLLFGAMLQTAGSDDQKALLETMIGGGLQGALAFAERNSRYNLAHVETTADTDGDGFVLNGSKAVVFNAVAAEKIIVVARTRGDVDSRDGISMFLVDADADGLTLERFRLMDGQAAANVRLNNVKVTMAQLVGALHKGLEPLESVIADATVAISAEAVGIMDVLTQKTVAYTKTRKQFGVAISSFQALQHRMVDMMIETEQTKSLLYRAVCAIEEGSDDVARSIAALKAKVGSAGRQVGAEAVQIHGGMGMTDELDIGHFMKRLMLINMWFGDEDYHQQRFADLSYN